MGTAIKPEGWDRTGMEAFKFFLYNPTTGEILSRTPLSWFKITAFYIVYYSFLAGFWLACLNVFFPYTAIKSNGTKVDSKSLFDRRKSRCWAQTAERRR